MKRVGKLYTHEEVGQVAQTVRSIESSDLLRKSLTSTSVEDAVFISYSSKDYENNFETIMRVCGIFAALKHPPYLDRDDEGMPCTTSAKTAERLGEKIESCSHFVLFATDAALQSRWVPWELGYADAIRRRKRLAVFPILESRLQDEGWAGSEYFGLYPRVEARVWPLGGVRVELPTIVFPDQRPDMTLRDWLKGSGAKAEPASSKES